MRKIILLSFTSLVLFSAFHIVQDWKTYKYKDEGFKAKFPSEPEKNEQAVNTEVGVIKIKMFNAEFEDKAFILAVNEYPSEYLNEDTPKDVVQTSLKNGMQGASNSLKGEVKESSFFELDGHPGIEARITFQEGKAVDYMRIIMVGSKMYQIQALGMKDSTVELDAKIFFESFKIL